MKLFVIGGPRSILQVTRATDAMISYTFIFDEETSIEFAVEVDSDTSVEQPGDPVPDWLALEKFRCEQCEIPAGSRMTCPAALSLKPAVEAFTARKSYETVHVVVHGSRGRLETTLPTQNAVRSVIGLLMALSSCPVMRKLRPMAQYHLPFSGREHSMFRFVGMYLIAQYLRQRHDQAPDWSLDGLLDLFNRLHKVNQKLAERIRAASKEDATVNSLIFLDTFATSAELDVEDCLAELEPLFAPYLD